MSLNVKPRTRSSISNCEDIEEFCAQNKTASFSISTRCRSNLARRDRSNSAPCKTESNLTCSRERSNTLKSMRSVSYNETLIKNNEFASPDKMKSPKLKAILEDKCLDSPVTKPLVKYLTIPTPKNSRMRKMTDKLHLGFLSRKSSKGKISAPTLIMTSSNIQTFDIENPAHELSFSQRLDEFGSSYYNMLKDRPETLNENASATKDQVRALTMATLNGTSDGEHQDADDIKNLIIPPKFEACELSFSRDVESLLQFLTTKTQEDMYRDSIYDLYDYTSEDDDPEIDVDSDFNLDVALARLMLSTSVSTPISTQ